MKVETISSDKRLPSLRKGSYSNDIVSKLDVACVIHGRGGLQVGFLVVQVVVVVYLEEGNVVALGGDEYFSREGCGILEGDEDFTGSGWWGGYQWGVRTWQLVAMIQLPLTMSPVAFCSLSPLDSSTLTTNRKTFLDRSQYEITTVTPTLIPPQPIIPKPNPLRNSPRTH